MKYTEQIVFVVSFGVVFYYAYGNTYDSAVNYEKDYSVFFTLLSWKAFLKTVFHFKNILHCKKHL